MSLEHSGMKLPALAPMHHSVGVDLDGDGVADVVGCDTTGDGKIDNFQMTASASQRAFLRDIRKQKRMFDLATEHFEWKEQMITVPVIMIGALAGLLSFVSGSALVTVAETQNWLALIVGTLATINTVLAGLQRTLRYGTRAEVFAGASSSYLTLITKLEFQIRETDKSGEGANDEWWKSVEGEALDVQKSLPFYPPPKLVTQWEVRGRIDNGEKENFENFSDQVVKSLKDMGVEEPSDLAFMSDEALAEQNFPEVTMRKIRQQRLKSSVKFKMMAGKSTSRSLTQNSDRILKLTAASKKVLPA